VDADIKAAVTSREDQGSIQMAFVVEYDGTDFVGFQRQSNGRTVQQSLEEALTTLFKKTVIVHGCSRTDSGVHARYHVSHADVPFLIPEEKLPLAMNAILPPDVCVKRTRVVSKDFHARFDSCGKEYVYRIWNSSSRAAVDRRFVAHVPGSLDIERMRTAAALLTGRHDFSAFCAQSSEPEKRINPVRTMESIEVRTTPGSPLIEIRVRGKSFLYNMVRILAGTILYAGQGKIDIADLEGILAGRDRRLAGKTMPAKGLTLEKVFYEEDPFNGEGD
jgi:tRNA pseudouridine38-40 synthase